MAKSEALRQAQKRYYGNNKEKILQHIKEWKKQNPDKVRQYNKNYRVNNEQYLSGYQRDYQRANCLSINGKIVKVKKRPRPETCELCGIVPNKLDYHHWDDGNPELGIWVCSYCHRGCELIEKGLDRKYLELKESIHR